MHLHTLLLPVLASECTRSLRGIHVCKCVCVYKNWLIFHHLDVMQVIKLLSVAFKHCGVRDDFLDDFEYRLPLGELQCL